MNNLGLPIYYRIDKFIPFDDFSIDTIHTIVQKEIFDRKEEYEGLYTAEQIYASVCSEIKMKMREQLNIKYKKLLNVYFSKKLRKNLKINFSAVNSISFTAFLCLKRRIYEITKM